MKKYLTLLIISVFFSVIIVFGHPLYFSGEYKKYNNPKLSVQDITLTSPINKTYSEPMNGYYPGTYGFENEKDGASGTDISFVDAIPIQDANTDVLIATSLGSHKKVLKITDTNAAGIISIQNNFDSTKTDAKIDFWFAISDITTSHGFGFDIYDGGSICIEVYINQDDLVYYDGLGWQNFKIGFILANTWYHVTLMLNDSANIFDGYVDGVKELTGGMYWNNSTTGTTNMRMSTGTNDQFTGYIDAVGYSWDPNYDTGDNLQEGLLLSFENSTALEWMGYSLDNQANNTILGNSTIPMPDYGVHNIQVFGNDTFSTYHQSDIVYFTFNFFKMNSPENLTYTGPMSGYYPATYGFENEVDDTSGTDIRFVDDLAGSEANTFVTVQAGNDGHNKVLELYDNNGAGNSVMKSESLSATSSGTIEFYIKTSDSTKGYNMNFGGLGGGAFLISIDNSNFRWYDGGTYYSIIGCLDDTWYHIKIEFETTAGGYKGLAADTYYMWINNVRYGPYDFVVGGDEIDFIQAVTYTLDSAYYVYLDAIGYSWDPNYNVGDNLQEGLLVSFENNSVLDWIGYSLDNQANKTILGNTTIPFPSEGIHTIQLFGNRSLGIMHQSDLQYFSVDLLPIIIINLPNQNEIFGLNAPSFNISIIENFLNETWYTLDNGVRNITFIGSTGIINQTEWDTQLDGPITIRFYANDTSGFENFEAVIVIKDTSAPIISITNPTADEFFGETTPSFSIAVFEPSLNTTWYTLDNGASNITFTGLTGTINQTEWDEEIEGSISIRFYANDTFGYINYAEIIVYKDTTDPVIIIHSPSFGEAYAVIPPAFNVSVDELNLDSIWYTIDGGLNNYTISQFTGYIYTSAWNTASIGAITIRFYAKDKAGNMVYEDTIIQKSNPPQPPDYTLITIILVISSIVGISVLGVIVYNKKYKYARQIKKQEKKLDKLSKLEKVQQERERLRSLKLEQERLRRDKLEQERLERERWEQERVKKLEEEARLRREKLEQERLERERQEQERIRKLEEEARKAEKETFERLRKIMSVSSRIKMDLVREYLKMDQHTFNSKVIDWADQFGFTIDGEYLNIRKESVPDFIDELEKQFSQWRKDEQGRESKM